MEQPTLEHVHADRKLLKGGGGEMTTKNPKFGVVTRTGLEGTMLRFGGMDNLLERFSPTSCSYYKTGSKGYFPMGQGF